MRVVAHQAAVAAQHLQAQTVRFHGVGHAFDLHRQRAGEQVDIHRMYAAAFRGLAQQRVDDDEHVFDVPQQLAGAGREIFDGEPPQMAHGRVVIAAGHGGQQRVFIAVAPLQKLHGKLERLVRLRPARHGGSQRAVHHAGGVVRAVQLACHGVCRRSHRGLGHLGYGAVKCAQRGGVALADAVLRQHTLKERAGRRLIQKRAEQQHAARLWAGHRHENIVQLQRIVHIVHGAFLQPVHGACAENVLVIKIRAQNAGQPVVELLRVLVGRAQQMRLHAQRGGHHIADERKGNVCHE